MYSPILLSAVDPGMIDWARAQFALTACYHWIFVPLTLGLAVVMACAETLYYIRKDDFWRQTAQFWQKLFGINFAIGVATGIILEFEFGTNWSNYSWIVGDIFGAPLAIEGILAFFMEATFVAVMFFGWDKVSKGFHLSATWLTGVGATLSAWWILVANSWMQHPVGMHFNPDTVRNEMMDFFAIAFSGEALTKFLHTVMSGWMTGAVFALGVCAWFLLKGRNKRMATESARLSAIIGLIATLATLATGDKSGVHVANNQPAKFAAMEGLEQGGTGVGLSIVPGIEVPNMLSFLATRDAEGFVPGFNEILHTGYTTHDGQEVPSAIEKMERGKLALKGFTDYRQLKTSNDSAAAEARKLFDEHAAYFGYGYIKATEELIPPTGIVYWAFRIMVGGGMYIMLALLLALFYVKRGLLGESKWVLYALIGAVPLVYLAGQCGWIVAEVGRQPWAIQDLLPVGIAASQLSQTAVVTTFCIFAVLFTLLLAVEVRIMCKAISEHKQ